MQAPILAFLLLLPVALHGQATPPPAAPTVEAARLEITPKGRLKVGSVGPREKKTLAYTFRNISAAPISLRVSELSPGVTVKGPALDSPIAPQASATLSLTLDPTDFVGVQRRSVRLLTDDPRQGQYLLPIEMTVRPDLTIDQEKKSFGDIGPHESPELSFRFTRESGLPLQIKLLTPLPPYLEREWESRANTAELRFIFRPKQVEPGVQLGLETLVVETNAPQQPRFTLYIDWKLRQPIEAKPTRLVFLDATTRRLELGLKSRNGESFRIQSAVIEGEGFSVESLPTGSAREHTLSLLRSTETEAKAMLVLRFSHQAELLKVPLAFLPASSARPN